MDRANLGSRIHRKLQGEGGDTYQSEVFLKLETTLDEELQFIIEGRADGVILDEENDQIIIDEIKTVSCDFDHIHEDMCFTHWAQAYCYAYIYALQNAKSSMVVQLTYYQIDIDEIKRFRRTLSFEDLQRFYMDMLQEYRKWALLQYNFEKVRNVAIKHMDFPFPTYRIGQRELAVSVYKTILDKDVMFVQAPTGIGKTLSTLFPSIKALGEGKAERIFYLCAKNVTAKVALDSIQLMQSQGLRLKCTSINAKDRMCMLEERNCDPEACPFANGYYDRVRPALLHLLEHHDFLDKELFMQYGEQHKICPFELSLDASLYSDVIICDYNYVFDPRVYLKRFFSDNGDYIFLIDEAHNMVDRARSMYSAQLQRSQFTTLRKLIGKEEKKLRKTLQDISKEFLRLDELCVDNFHVQKEPHSSLASLLNTFQKECDLYLQKEHDNNESAKDVYFEVLAYQRIAEYYDEQFVTYIQSEIKDITIKQYCLNPAKPISDTLHKGKAAIFFSATLTPIRYFTTLLLQQECEKKIALPSPFAKERCKVILHNGIDTRYKVRSQSIAPICDIIFTTITAKSGNYIVFFPSYAYLKEVVEDFIDQYPDLHVEIQQSSMDEQERQNFLSLFTDTEDTMICFCVLGGMFSEGIDLKGDMLLGVIVIGVGLPQINHEQNLIRDYFDDVQGCGYDYAYVFPGMNKVLQAAGRVIRTLQDRGVVVLVDERYTSSTYRPLFPQHLRHYEIIQNHRQLANSLQFFWEGIDHEEIS